MKKKHKPKNHVCKIKLKKDRKERKKIVESTYYVSI